RTQPKVMNQSLCRLQRGKALRVSVALNSPARSRRETRVLEPGSRPSRPCAVSAGREILRGAHPATDPRTATDDPDIPELTSGHGDRTRRRFKTRYSVGFPGARSGRRYSLDCGRHPEVRGGASGVDGDAAESCDRTDPTGTPDVDQAIGWLI